MRVWPVQPQIFVLNQTNQKSHNQFIARLGSSKVSVSSRSILQIDVTQADFIKMHRSAKCIMPDSVEGNWCSIV